VVNQPSVLRELFSGKEGNLVQKGANSISNIIKYGTTAYLLNNALERFSGKRPAFDPFGLIDDALKSEKETSTTQVGLGRVPSKSFVKLVDLPGKALDALTAMNRIGNISDLPLSTFVTNIKPFAETIIDSSKSSEDKKEYLNDFLLKFGAAFVKGGNQLRKTVTGVQAVAYTYNDPKYTNLNAPPDWTEWSDSKIEDEGSKILDKNLYEKASKSIKIQMGYDALRAVIFGAKASNEYRDTIAQSVDLQKQLKQARINIQLATTPKEEAAARRELDDLQRYIYEQNLSTRGGKYKPLPLPEDPEVLKKRAEFERKRKK